MAQNITLFKTQYSGVTNVDLPKTAGGTARFSDASVTTAVESDVASGKTFIKADGSVGTGTNSGGGGGSVDFVVFEKELSFSSLTTSAQTLVTQAELVAAGVIESSSVLLTNAWDSWEVELLIAGNTHTTKQILWSWASSRPIYYSGTTGYTKQGRYHNTSTTTASTIQSTAAVTASTNGYLYVSSAGIQFRATTTYGLYGSYVIRVVGRGKN